MIVEEADRTFFTALRERGGTTLASLLTDDFVLVDVMRGAEVLRAEFIGAVGAGQLRFDAINVLSSRTRQYGPAAIVIGGGSRPLRVLRLRTTRRGAAPEGLRATARPLRRDGFDEATRRP